MRLCFICEETGRIRAINQMLKIEDPIRKKKVIEAILQADPDEGKRFSLWLTTLINRGFVGVTGVIAATPNTQVRLPEDNPRIQKVLLAFQKALKKLPPDQRDITRFKDFYTVEDAVDKLIQAGAVVAATSARKVPGAEIVYQTPPYVVYKVDRTRVQGKRVYDGAPPPTPEADMATRIKAIETLGMGPPETKWCTRAAYSSQTMARHYLATADMYVIYKDGKPFIQKCGKQVMDVNDRSVQLPPEIAEVCNPILKRNANTGTFPPGLSIKESTLVTATGNRIPCIAIADSMKPFYYFAVGPNTTWQTHRLGAGMRAAARLGIVQRQLNPEYTNPEWHALRQKQEQASDDLQTLWRSGSSADPGWMLKTHELQELRNTIAMKLRGGPKELLVSGPRNILTINKENVADIIDGSGRSLKVSQPAIPGAPGAV